MLLSQHCTSEQNVFYDSRPTLSMGKEKDGGHGHCASEGANVPSHPREGFGPAVSHRIQQLAAVTDASGSVDSGSMHRHAEGRCLTKL